MLLGDTSCHRPDTLRGENRRHLHLTDEDTEGWRSSVAHPESRSQLGGVRAPAGRSRRAGLALRGREVATGRQRWGGRGGPQLAHAPFRFPSPFLFPEPFSMKESKPKTYEGQ